MADDDPDFDFEKFLREESNSFNQEREVARILELEETSKNPFEILNVDPKIWTKPPGSALHIHEWIDPALIKKLFREKSLLVHPDKCSLEKAPEAFQLLKKAQSQLSNPDILKELYHYTRDAIYLTKTGKGDSPIADIILTVRRLIKDVNDRIQLRIKNTEERDVEQVTKQVDDLIKVAKLEKELAQTREKRVGSWRDWQAKGPKKKKVKRNMGVLG